MQNYYTDKNVLSQPLGLSLLVLEILFRFNLVFLGQEYSIYK